ncbi:MAG: hypothetical protein J1F40_10370 [Prevotellaceae bacterium]|nr:hypothetical protein [Prevotellaceae bacterium]
MKHIIYIIAFVLSLPLFAQNNDNWEPIGNWPFINRQFRTATVYTGIFNRSKTVVPCNIHVGKQALWYSQNDTLMEAIPGSVLRVEFPNGDTYIPVGREQMFGRIVREDSINGKVARVICVRTLNQGELDQRYVDYLNKTQNILQGSSLGAIADSEGGKILEEEPLPLTNVFYFQVNGEIFQATQKNILAHIPQQRRKEYRVYTRSAEVISTNESSMLKVWENFFLK